MTSILNKFPYTQKVDWEELYIEAGEVKERFSALITWLEKQGTFIGNDASRTKWCFGCNEEGHFQNSCPKAGSNQGAASRNNAN